MSFVKPHKSILIQESDSNWRLQEDSKKRKVFESSNVLENDYQRLNDLIRIMVTRFEIDMPLINEIYKKLYNVSMLKDIKDDTSGSYQTLLLTLASSGNYTISSSFLKTYTKKILLFILLFINFSR